MQSAYRYFKPYFLAINKLALPKRLTLVLLLFGFLIYPGQNFYQTLIIHDGAVKGEVVTQNSLTEYPFNDGVDAPEVTAQAVIIQDVNSKTHILTKNQDAKLLPASTTKIMTALVAIDHFSDLNQIITIDQESQAIGHAMNLYVNEQITVENLLYGLLVESGNDAALALANNYCAPRSQSGEVGSCGYDAFINAMNVKARSLNLTNTTYKNPSGVEQYNHLTSARDLAVLASYAVKNPAFNRIMQTQSITITDVTGEISHYLSNTNQLLGKVEGVKGLKTGWTQNAGECLVTYTERNVKGIITVVLNSVDRFGESEQLIEWAYNHHIWSIPEFDIN